MEVMSPVGSYESLAAAIQAGADSVYFGVGNLNMRSRSAANFQPEDIGKIVGIAREHGVKTYLTVNTIVYNEELGEMRALLDAAHSAGVTAVIASDLAAITAARERGLEVHISTQCNISNTEAVRFFSQFADVVVTARELTLRQVAEITRYIEEHDIRGPRGELVQVEIFAHGALCMSVSGKCYLSLDFYNQSANRGACLQLCRRGYIVRDEESDMELQIDNKYIMSPKDLCTIGFLDKISKAGVRVLKIEGRGRSADYVKTVTECYKEATQTLVDGSYSQDKVEAWTKRLRTVFNRGFWDGYYLGRKMGEWSERYGSQATENRVYLGTITNYFSRLGVAEARIQTDQHLCIGDDVQVTGQTTGVHREKIGEVRMDNGPVEAVGQGDVFSFKCSQPIRRGDKLYRIDRVIDEF